MTMEQATKDERRRAPRADLVLRVDYDGKASADYLTDLGEGGLFICTARPFEVGQTIDFAISFPGLLEPVTVQGVVRWKSAPTPADPDAPQGVGVQFVEQGPAEREAIARLLSRLDRIETARPAPDRPFRVLLVEDNAFAHKLFLHAVKRFHSEWGQLGTLEIVAAQNGVEAIAKLESITIDLALVDFFLPVMGGAELIRRIRATPAWSHTPVLVVSVGGQGVREEALAAGADLYLDKPVLLRQLLTTLRLLLVQREKDRAQKAIPEGR
jgi:uncharacterized protein (TIGR02266 family)